MFSPPHPHRNPLKNKLWQFWYNLDENWWGLPQPPFHPIPSWTPVLFRFLSLSILFLYARLLLFMKLYLFTYLYICLVYLFLSIPAQKHDSVWIGQLQADFWRRRRWERGRWRRSSLPSEIRISKENESKPERRMRSGGRQNPLLRHQTTFRSRRISKSAQGALQSIKGWFWEYIFA